MPAIGRLLQYQTHWGPGHYYSPIPDTAHALAVSRAQQDRFLPMQGIDLRDQEQLGLFEQLVAFMKESPFRNEEKSPSHRFFNNNGIYGYSDALVLESMIRLLRPSRIVEAGSGFTSALMMDVNSKYFGNAIQLEFIEPYPERLFKLLSAADKNQVRIHVQGLQTVDLSTFSSLKNQDILFIDSSHVAKVGSDLLYLFFEILPVLAPGVYIHFHDIFNNFEYPENHFTKYKGFGWNENYFLRAFLMNNPQYEVVLFTNYLDLKYSAQILHWMPDYPLRTGGQFWIRKR